MKSEKLRILSGIKPTGKLHIGNYLGAITNFLELQKTHDCFFFIPDFHSLTIAFDPKEKREQIFELMVEYLAIGLDPKKSTLFIQSHVPEHTELTWIFNCITPYSELKRMTQFKDMSLRDPKNVNAGLFDYPVLQAADVLLYKPFVVPVGKDQEQHLELARLTARTFNKKFGELFPEPKPLFTVTYKVMSLTDPSKKMSKSHGMDKVIAMDEEPEDIKKKIRKAVTNPQGIKNLQTLIEAFGGGNKYDKNNNLEMKDMLSNLIADHFAEYRKKKKQLMNDKSAVVSAFSEGAKKARKIASTTMIEVKERVGLI